MALRVRPDPAAEVDPVRLDIAAVFRDHYAFVWTNLHRFGVPHEQIEDAAQDVFVVVARHLAEFEGRATLRTWLYTIARRVAYRCRRSTARRVRKLLAFRDEPRENMTLDGIARTDSSLLVHHFLAQLDHDKREAFVLAELEGLSGPEIADALGIKVRTAYSRIRLAREAFDRMLARMHAEEDRVLLRQRVLAQARAADTPPQGTMRRAMAVFFARLPEVSGAGATGAAAQTGLVAKAGAAGTTVSLVGSAKTVLIGATLSTMVTVGVITAVTTGMRNRENVARGASSLDDGTAQNEPAAPDLVVSTVENVTADRLDVTSADANGIPIDAAELVEPRSIGRAKRAVVEHSTATASAPPNAGPMSVSDNELTVDGILLEKQLLENALMSLEENNPRRALESLDRAARELKGGVLVSERRKLRIRALCVDGRVAQARGEAEAWRRTEPSSPHAKAAVLLCPR